MRVPDRSSLTSSEVLMPLVLTFIAQKQQALLLLGQVPSKAPYKRLLGRSAL